jgi:hypothetical protein
MQVVWRPQSGPQKALIDCPLTEILYGGARGGGKTDGVLGKYAIKGELYGRRFNAVFFRRQMPQQDDLIERAKDIYCPIGSEWHEQKKMFRLPAGGRIRFRPLENIQDAEKYQGQNLTDAAVEEAGNYPDAAPIDRLFGCLRSTEGVPIQLILTANPGGPGNEWLKSRYVNPAPLGMVPIIRKLPTGKTHSAIYIPSKVHNNRILLASDPGYVDRLHLVGDEELVRAWLEGDWDVAAGAMFADVFKLDRHLIEPFKIPSSWYIDRSYDWGSSSPFAVLWWAESDGTEAVMADGTKRHFPKGTLFLIGEWYGWNGRPNEGCGMADSAVARGILQREEGMGLRGRVRPGPADGSIFTTTNGDSIAAEHLRMGVRWLEADKRPGSRILGWEAMRRRFIAGLQSPVEQPALFAFNTCPQFVRTIRSLPRDPRKREDADSHAEDHIADAARYRILHLRTTVTSRSLY